MAILKFKKLLEDIEKSSHLVIPPSVIVSISATSGTSGSSGSAGSSGTSGT